MASSNSSEAALASGNDPRELPASTNGTTESSAPPTASTSTPAAPSPRHEEYQYLDLIKTIISTGQVRPDRTGTGTIALFAPPALRFSLADGTLPLLTTKRVFFRGVLEELLWFISGSTSMLSLQQKDIHIWDGNGSRAFLDSRGLSHREEGDLGPVYGFQWRHFGAKYEDCRADYKGKGVDQLEECIWKIKNNPTDRRIVLSAWNPADLPLMALPPCHMFCQFYVTLPPPGSPEGTKPLLSCLMYQRSCDLGLGIPFNIASYSLLTHMIALVTDTTPHEFILQMGDAHVYRDHVDALGVQGTREPREFPKLRWTRGEEELRAGGIDGFRTEDFEVLGYKPHAKLEMKMSV